jgi:two-component system, NarL family, response regulator NreC
MSMRVLIVDDHKIMREGLRSLLEKQPGVEIIAEAENAQKALKLVEEFKPDLVIMDVVMPSLNGIETTRRMLAKAPNVKVIALSMHADKRFVMEMLRAGASGYLLKDCAFEELDEAIRAVIQDRTYITPRIIDIIVKDYFSTSDKPSSSALSALTSRQYEVLQLLAEGKTTREIAHQMSLSVKTIESHRQQIISKLNIRSVAGLTKYAIREGLISPDM